MMSFDPTYIEGDLDSRYMVDCWILGTKLTFVETWVRDSKDGTNSVLAITPAVDRLRP